MTQFNLLLLSHCSVVLAALEPPTLPLPDPSHPHPATLSGTVSCQSQLGVLTSFFPLVLPICLSQVEKRGGGPPSRTAVELKGIYRERLEKGKRCTQWFCGYRAT